MGIVVIVIDGMAFGAWKRFEASRSVGEATASFELEVSEGQLLPPIWTASGLRAGAPCTILLDGQLAITGRIDQVSRAFDADTHTVRIAGRGKAADLVDSSAIPPGGGQLKNQTLDAVAGTIAEPFGMPVAVDGDAGAPFPNVQIQPGETAFAVVERLARQRGFLVHEDRDGILRLDHGVAARPPARLEEGMNIYRASSEMKAEGRHSEYIVKGQRKGDDHVSGTDAAHVEATATDPAVAAYRPLVVLAEGWTDRDGARRRADHEATARAAEGVAANVTVVGWLKDDGSIWDAGDPVHLASPTLAVDLDMVVKTVTWSLADGDGTLTELTLAPPEALDSSAAGGSSSPAGTGSSAAARAGGTATAPGGISTDGGWIDVKPTKEAT